VERSLEVYQPLWCTLHQSVSCPVAYTCYCVAGLWEMAIYGRTSLRFTAHACITFKSVFTAGTESSLLLRAAAWIWRVISRSEMPGNGRSIRYSCSHKYTQHSREKNKKTGGSFVVLTPVSGLSFIWEVERNACTLIETQISLLVDILSPSSL
jgi:hypothetical protein